MMKKLNNNKQCGNRVVVGFAGRKRVGKTMMANEIKKQLGDNIKTKIITIADNLKKLCAELLEVSYDDMIKMKDDGTTFNKVVDQRWVDILHNTTGITINDIEHTLKGKTFTNVREVLQFIGTDLIRKYNNDWHINKTIEEIEGVEDGTIIFIDDVRFPNEKKAITDFGGDVFFIIRPTNFDVSNHISETSLVYSDFEVANVIINDCTISKIVNDFIKVHINGGVLNDTRFLIALEDYFVHPWMRDVKNVFTNKKLTKVFEVLKKQNKDRLTVNCSGALTFHSDDNEVSHILIGCLLPYLHNRVIQSYYTFYNPLINETLKMFF